MKTADALALTIRQRKLGTSGIAIAEVVVGMALIAMIMASLFAANAQLLGMLRRGSDSAFASQMIAERFEDLRTAGTFDVLTLSDNLKAVLARGGATEANLKNVTETVTVEPYVNPGAVRLRAVRQNGASTVSGSDLTGVQLVKVNISVKWRTGGTERERQFMTVMSAHRR
jgi:hypothetical protein